MAGVIGIEQIAREGEQAAPVLRLPIRADRVVFVEPCCGFGVLERGEIGGDSDLTAALLAAEVHHRVQERRGQHTPRVEQ